MNPGRKKDKKNQLTSSFLPPCCPGLANAATAASFVRPTRPAQTPRTFLEALHDKYAGEVSADGRGGTVVSSSGPQIVISGKVAEEVGFDKIRRQLANLDELKIAILDGMRVAYAHGPDDEKSIRETSPRITELDLSRALFTDFGEVADMCAQLQELRFLRVK